MFEVIKKDNRSKARVGVLKTEHGLVATPSYVIVGTHAEVRTLTPPDLHRTKTQMIISNTYHLWRRLGEKLKTYPGLHKEIGWNGTIMTDSGGFQVFSLGFGREHGVGKIANIFPGETSETHMLRPEENLVRVTEDGVYFREGDKNYYLDAETSISIQESLGADIILAFDECTSPLHDHEYTRAAMERTHRWAKRSLGAKKRDDQKLYGIVQGGAFQDLREASARLIGGLSFDGFAIGGSLGNSRREMFKVIDWTILHLPENKPRHLLGIGKINDLFEAVELGVDTFDCVIPTREARHAGIWTKDGRIQINKEKYKNDRAPLDKNCFCPVCSGDPTINRAMLSELFRAKNPDAARLATIHNVYFFNDLMEQIRKAILEGTLQKLKQKTLTRP